MSTVKTISFENLVHPKDLTSTRIVASPSPLFVSAQSAQPDGKTKTRYYIGSQILPQPIGQPTINQLYYIPNTTYQFFDWYTGPDYDGDGYYSVSLTDFLTYPKDQLGTFYMYDTSIDDRITEIGGFENYPNLATIDIEYQNLQNPPDVSKVTNLYGYEMYYTGNFSTLNLSNHANLRWIYIENAGPITSVNIDNCPSIDSLDIEGWDQEHYSGSRLTPAAVNYIFETLDANGLYSGFVYISGGMPNATPTGTGLTAKNNLVGKGWNVYYNEPLSLYLPEQTVWWSDMNDFQGTVHDPITQDDFALVDQEAVKSLKIYSTDSPVTNNIDANVFRIYKNLHDVLIDNQQMNYVSIWRHNTINVFRVENCPNLDSIDIENCPNLTTLSLSGSANMEYIYSYSNNNLTTVDLTGLSYLVSINFEQCKLSSSTQASIISNVTNGAVSNSIYGGYINFGGAGNDALTDNTALNVDIPTLVGGYGWTVYYNTALPSPTYNALYFNGQRETYLRVPIDDTLKLGTGDFTIEWFMVNGDGGGDYPRIFSFGTYPAALGVSIESDNLFYWYNRSNNFNFGNVSSYRNSWYHFALTRNNGDLKLFIDGSQVGSTYTGHDTDFNWSYDLVIGNENVPNRDGAFKGYISSFHIVKGTALYTDTFTPPTAPLSVVSDTVLLLRVNGPGNNLVLDSSNYNKTVYNNGNNVTYVD